MYLSDLALTDFRSYERAIVALEPGVTVLVGENGQGKTNLIEAVGYLSTLSSHRVSGDAAGVSAGGEVFAHAAMSDAPTCSLASRRALRMLSCSVFCTQE